MLNYNLDKNGIANKVFPCNFVYDSEGNLTEDCSKSLKISYDWRGMPTEFLMETIAKNELNPAGDSSRDSVRLRMAYDGSGRRVSKTRERKTETGDWIRESVMHYTGIGTEVRENYSEGSFQDARVVVNMPHGLGRYGVENATAQNVASDFEWYLKNHLGSTMLVYGTQGSSNADVADLGEVKKAYDYRSFGEQIDLIADAGDKVTENFTGKERDDETELNYFGARYLDPMLGLWTSVDPARQFASPYLYAGNGVNPIGAIDPDGNFTLGAQVRGSASTPTGYSASAGTTFSVMIDFDRLKARMWPVLYSKSVDVGSGIGGGVGASAGFFFNSSSPQIGSYTTAHVDLSAKAGIGIGGSVTPPEAGDGRYDVMLSGGIGYEGYVGVTLEHGDIQEFHPKDAINNMFESKIKDMAENPEDYAE